jgi:excisionase family DNA binding protein
MDELLTFEQVRAVLKISQPTLRALLHGGVLPAIRVGQRGQWRISRRILEGFIASGGWRMGIRAYSEPKAA